jgi:hypothetical protein
MNERALNKVEFFRKESQDDEQTLIKHDNY